MIANDMGAILLNELIMILASAFFYVYFIQQIMIYSSLSAQHIALGMAFRFSNSF